MASIERRESFKPVVDLFHSVTRMSDKIHSSYRGLVIGLGVIGTIYSGFMVGALSAIGNQSSAGEWFMGGVIAGGITIMEGINLMSKKDPTEKLYNSLLRSTSSKQK